MVRLEELSNEDSLNSDQSDEDSTSSDQSGSYGVTRMKLPCHDHPMCIVGGVFDCSGCTEKYNCKGYHCSDCKLYLHKECAESPSEINHPSHTRHPLTLLKQLDDHSHIDSCRLCGVIFRSLFYHCSQCEFSLDPVCARKPPPLTVEHPKGHEHLLTLMPRVVVFTCNACGMVADRSPYIASTYFLGPRVININRHHHRVSRTYFLGPGNWVCGVCRLKIDGKYGAYSCLKCPQYAVHSRCGTRADVWDGKELEDEPEEEMEDVEPFKVVDEHLINHFSHEEHNLRFKEGGSVTTGNEGMHCRACVLPIDIHSFYSCVDCDFILHEVCANLPRKKRHVLHHTPLTLQTHIPYHKLCRGVFQCSACTEFSSGFSYTGSGIQLDMRCGSINEPFVHQGHPHPLFYTLPDSKTCGACKKMQEKVLNCIECDFALCFRCATLPYVVRTQKHDMHPITLCFGEKASGQYWCDICETRLNPNICFYTCEDCASSYHVHCVHIRGFIHVKPGDKLSFAGYGFEMVLGNRINRPHCESCYQRCEGSFLQSTDYKDMYACSLDCFYEFPEC